MLLCAATFNLLRVFAATTMSATNAPPFFVRGTYNRNNGTFVCASGPGFSREYRLKRKIGSGSQSSCFLASSPFVKEDVCLKMLHQYKMKSKKCLHTNTYSIIKTEPPIEGKTGDLVWIKDDFTISVCHRSDAGELTELTLREHVELFGVPNNFDTCDKINPSKRCLPTHFQKFLKSRKKKLLEVELANRVADRCEGNVVRVYRVLEDFGSTWPFHHTMILVTKCFTGGDMFEFLTNCCRGGLRETAALSIIRQVSTALSAAHSVGVVHQDLKVENLLLAERGSLDKVALCDFGLAEHCRPIFNQTVGSACSFAPEKFPTSGSSEFDPLLAESWSLGVLL